MDRACKGFDIETIQKMNQDVLHKTQKSLANETLRFVAYKKMKTMKRLKSKPRVG